MSSDIFDAYAKLALERGLIKNSEESKELKRYKDDEYPRAGSDTEEVIKALYGIKPDSSIKYKNNIMEAAHPEKVILTPAYDRINALIENNIERQKIMINITQKPVNGHLTQHKYAQQDLALALTKVANDMDNQDMDELRLLADACLDQLYKEALDLKDIENFFKGTGSDVVDVGEGAATGAGIGAVIGGLLGVFGGPLAPATITGGAAGGAYLGGALGAAIAALFKTGPQAKNVELNAGYAQQTLLALMKQHEDLFLQKLYDALGHIATTAREYSSLLDKSNLSSQDESLKEQAKEYGSFYQKEIVNLDRMIDIFLDNAKNGRYEEKETTWSKLTKPVEWITGSELSDAVKAMQKLEIVSDAALKGIESTRQLMSQAKQEDTENKKQQQFTPYKLPENKEKTDPGLLSQFEEAMKTFSDKF